MLLPLPLIFLCHYYHYHHFYCHYYYHYYYYTTTTTITLSTTTTVIPYQVTTTTCFTDVHKFILFSPCLVELNKAGNQRFNLTDFSIDYDDIMSDNIARTVSSKSKEDDDDDRRYQLGDQGNTISDE